MTSTDIAIIGAGAAGLGNLLARYGSDIPVLLNTAVRKIDKSGSASRQR